LLLAKAEAPLGIEVDEPLRETPGILEYAEK
jgi:hypothetical protein